MKCIYSALLAILILPTTASAMDIDEHCTVNIMNRTVQVQTDGTWRMNNVPSFMGRVRARATCVGEGATTSGQSEFFSLSTNNLTVVEDIFFDDPSPVPVSLSFSESADISFQDVNESSSLAVRATYSDGTVSPVLNASNGINFVSSNDAIVAVDANGALTPVSSGRALITARLEGTVAVKQVTVMLSGDMDGDGLPDSYEIANGLDPNDPVDALEDSDKDGLNAIEEFSAGTDINNADTDTDGIKDGEELVEGIDGYITNPLLADTDGDGFSDGLEVNLATDPSDSNSFDLVNAMESITVTPSTLQLIFNGINTEVSDQITVLANLIDGGQKDITSSSFGTSYSSADLSIASFGVNDGEVFGGVAGTTTVTASNNGYSDSISVNVERFDPVALSAINIPGYANNVDIQGDYAYVAAGSAGLVVVNVSDREAPVIAGQLDTRGTAIDIKVIGNTVYLASGEAGIQLINVADPANPLLISEFNTAGVARDIAVDLRYVYVADEEGGLDIINIVEPAEPFSVSTLDNLGNLRGIAVEQNLLVAVSDTTMHMVDIEDSESPVVVSSFNVGQIKDVVISGDYVYMAVSSGYKVYNVSIPEAPVEVGSEGGFSPRDVVLSNDLLLFAERLFPNGIAYVNVLDPEDAVFQGIIDLFSFGAHKGNGIAADSRFTYVTGEIGSPAADYAATGDTRLFIAQHRQQFDNLGQAPLVSITTPISTAVVVEGTNQLIEVNAVDDVAVEEVQFIVDGQVVYIDTTAPYQALYSVPVGVSSIELSATAIDLGGNTNSTTAITFSVQPDTDTDGLGDDQELNDYNTLPNNPDTDGDGLNDGREVLIGTDPNVIDSDGDGLGDADEVVNGTDPLNPDITPPAVQATVPADGSTDIPESSTIEIEFNEPLLRRSVSSNVVDVREAETNIGVSGRLTLTNANFRLSFEPDELLKDYTEYVVTVSSVKDSAGNVIAAPFETRFTSGNVVDTQRPFIESIAPYASATNVPSNAVINIKLNERVRIDSFSDSNIYLRDTITNTNVLSTVTLSEDRTSITLIPTSALPVGRRFYTRVSGLRDLYDNAINTTNNYFTVSFEADTQAPQLVGMSILDGQTDVPTNAVIEVQFDEPVSSLQLNGINLLRDGNIVPVQSRTLSDGNSKVRLHFAELLKINTNYVLSAEGVEDFSGNIQSTAVESAFSTGAGANLTALDLVANSPYSNQTNVVTNTRISIQFNQRINPLTLSGIRLYDTVAASYVDVDTVLERGDTLVVTPHVSLIPNRAYYITYVTALSSLTGRAYNVYLPFTTGSTEATELTVTDWTIPDGYDAMPVNGQFVIDFNSALDILTCPIENHVTISDGISNIAFTGSVSAALGRARLHITPTTELSPNTAYTLTLDGLCDNSGNVITATSQAFTTANTSDTTGPTLVSVTPEANATDVSVTTPVVWTFSEPVWFTQPSINTQVYLYVDDTNNKLPGELTWNTDHTVLTFTPSAPYPANTVIQRRLPYNFLRDLASNTLSYNASSSSSFTTNNGSGNTTAPTIVQVIPEDGAIDIDRDNNIVLTFSKPLDYQTLTTTNLGLYANGSSIPVSISRSYDNQTITLSTSHIPANSVVSIIATDGIRDLEGNALSDFISLYSTAAARETTRPSVHSIYPGNNANNVRVDKNIVIYTNEPVNSSTVTDETLRVSQNGLIVTGGISVSGNAQVITFTPDQPWIAGSTIQVFAQNGIQDLNGNPLNNYQALFRTATDDDATSALTVIATSNLSGLPTNARVGFLYNKPLNPLTVNTTSVRVYDYTQNAYVTPEITLTNNDRVLEVSMPSGWSTNTNFVSSRHRLRVTNVEDIYGNTSSRDADFYTANEAVSDTLAPTVEAMSPVNGTSDVGINAQVNIRFSETINPLTFNTELQDTLLQSVSLSTDNKLLTYIPHAPFAASSNITLAAPPVEDSAGNSLVPYSVDFTTAAGVDLTAPTVVQASPQSSEAVPVNSVMQVHFTEAIVPESINSSTVQVYDTVESRYIDLTYTQSSDYQTVTVVPTEALAVGRRYQYTVASVRDMAFNRSGTLVNRYFTTDFDADTQAPQLVGMSIIDGYTDVPTNAVLEMQFDEPLSVLDLAGLNVLQGGTIVPLQTRILSDGNRRVRLQLVSLLDANSDYVLRAEGVVDLSGNVQSTAVESAFSTGAGANLLPLIILDHSPYYNQTNVVTNTRISIKYNQRISPLTLSTIKLRDTVGGYVEADVALARDDTVIITPRSTLLANQVYYHYLNVSSLTGRAFNVHLQFTTGSTEPSELIVTDWTIPAGYDAMPINGQLVIDFTSALDILTCPIENHVTISDGISNIAFIGSVSATLGRARLHITPTTGLSPNTAYTLTLDGLCDNAGNLMELNSQVFITTDIIDITRPTLVSVTPVSNSVGVDILTPVIWTFSEPVWYTQRDINSGIYLYEGNTNNKLPGEYAWNDNHTVLTFTPSEAYPANAVIQKQLQYNYLKDLSGNTPSHNVIFYGQFSTQ